MRLQQEIRMFQTLGRWPFKHQREREDNFLNYLMIIQMILNHHTSKEGLSFKCLVNWTHYVHKQWDQLLIMLLLENTDLDSSLGKILIVHTVYTPSNQEDTFSTIVADLMAIGIWEVTLSATLSCFWNLTQMCLLFLTILSLLVWAGLIVSYILN